MFPALSLSVKIIIPFVSIAFFKTLMVDLFRYNPPVSIIVHLNRAFIFLASSLPSTTIISFMCFRF